MSKGCVGGQCRRSVSAVSVGGQCRRSVSAVSVGGQCLRDLRDLRDLRGPRGPRDLPRRPPERKKCRGDLSDSVENHELQPIPVSVV